MSVLENLIMQNIVPFFFGNESTKKKQLRSHQQVKEILVITRTKIVDALVIIFVKMETNPNIAFTFQKCTLNEMRIVQACKSKS